MGRQGVDGGRGLGDRKHEEQHQFIQSQAGPFEEQTSHFLVDDVDNPYTFPEDRPFLWRHGVRRATPPSPW